MKRLLAVTAMLFLPLAVMAQVQHLKFTNNGEFVSLSEATGPLGSFSVTASRNTTNSGTAASISYSSVNIASDFSSLTFVEIFGAIPPADITGASVQNMALNFSTADLDPNNSFSLSCTLDLNTFQETCSAGPSGTISLSFRATSAVSTTSVLHQESTVGKLTTRLNQRSDNTSATAQGTVFGTTVVGGNATVGINHGSTLEAIRQ